MDDDTPLPAVPDEPVYDALGDARRLLRTTRSGALATLAADTGHPFATLVNVATDVDSCPLLLLSSLAAHTANLARDARCSLLLTPGGKGDPLAHPRLTVLGTAHRTSEASVRDRFLRRHPKAGLYAGFADFGLWRLAAASAHLNGGFGRAAAIEGLALLTDIRGADALMEAEAGAVEHLNRDHGDALRLYARLAGHDENTVWRATGIDPDGLDLLAGDRAARLVYPERVVTPAALRAMLVRLARDARQAG